MISAAETPRLQNLIWFCLCSKFMLVWDKFAISTELVEKEKFTSRSFHGNALNILILATEQFIGFRI